MKEPSEDYGKNTELLSLSPNAGLTGDFKSLTLIDQETIARLNYPVSWLISERFADCWLAFLKKLPF